MLTLRHCECFTRKKTIVTFVAALPSPPLPFLLLAFSVCLGLHLTWPAIGLHCSGVLHALRLPWLACFVTSCIYTCISLNVILRILCYWCKNQSYYWLVTSWLLCYVKVIVFYTLLVKILVMYSFYNKI
jgi:hypothetical protein